MFSSLESLGDACTPVPLFQGRVKAQDGGSPPRSATATVKINILRNLNAPSFASLNYNRTILETAALNDVLVTVVATDSDRRVRWFLNMSLRKNWHFCMSAVKAQPVLEEELALLYIGFFLAIGM